ncbi:MAG: hypothetical protein JW927_16240 [Deltaproteobacteria bacterium]|nr:hypothetical protein [Deltaproteobacteria bacterium]
MIIILVLSIQGCNIEVQKIKDFESDGCTLFPDNSSILKSDWCDCCFEHDIAYWQGGTEDERLKADETLRDCVKEKSGNENLANVIYKGVRSGGSPYFYNWYRWGYGWGYGWGYDRKYKKLTVKEKKEVENKLKEYFSRNIVHPCS